LVLEQKVEQGRGAAATVDREQQVGVTLAQLFVDKGAVHRLQRVQRKLLYQRWRQRAGEPGRRLVGLREHRFKQAIVGVAWHGCRLT
jgi:hypothetical protein